MISSMPVIERNEVLRSYLLHRIRQNRCLVFEPGPDRLQVPTLNQGGSRVFAPEENGVRMAEQGGNGSCLEQEIGVQQQQVFGCGL